MKMCNYSFSTYAELTVFICLSIEKSSAFAFAFDLAMFKTSHQRSGLLTHLEAVSLACAEALDSILRGKMKS